MAFPSTFADLQNAVIAKTRLDAANSADVSKVKDWINQTYTRVCLETECLVTDATMTLTANSASYTLPSAAARIKYMVIQQAGNNAYGPPLRLTSLDEILWRRVSSGGTGVTNGTATYYTLKGSNELELWPTPGGADTMLMYYVQLPTPLSAGTDVPQIDEPYASKLLEFGTLMDAADYLKDIISNYTYPQSFDDWLYRFRQHLARKQGTQSKDFRIPGPRYYAPHDPSTDIGV